MNPALPKSDKHMKERKGWVKKRLKAILSSYEGRREELIPMLQKVQAKFGYLSEEAMVEIAKFTRE